MPTTSIGVGTDLFHTVDAAVQAVDRCSAAVQWERCGGVKAVRAPDIASVAAFMSRAVPRMMEYLDAGEELGYGHPLPGEAAGARMFQVFGSE